MATPFTVGAVGAAFAAIAIALSGRLPPSTAGAVERHVVLAELFTSEGCSSCPPADRLLQQITSTSPVDGVEVIGLEEHVDYWDRLGWRDPFSSPAFTARQSDYAARAFRTTNIYTPQLVVDGAFETVGSDRADVRAAIANAAGRPAASVLVRATGTRDRVHVDIAVDVPPSVERRDTADVEIAVAEDGLTSRVGRGENGGRTLSHTAVVRSLITADAIPPAATTRIVTVDLPLAPEWRTTHLRVVGFVQERQSRRVLGAGAASLVTESR